MTRAKHALSDVEGTRRRQDSEKQEKPFFAPLAAWRKKFLKWFFSTFAKLEA
jgi:hypothetical protein